MLQASEELKRSVLALARRVPGSPLRGRRPSEVEARDGGLHPKGGTGESYVAILSRAGRPAVEARIGSDSRLGRAVGQFRFVAGMLNDRRRWVRAATGAHFCEVRVDADTGEVRVSRWVSVFDVGTGDQPEDGREPAARRRS